MKQQVRLHESAAKSPLPISSSSSNSSSKGISLPADSPLQTSPAKMFTAKLCYSFIQCHAKNVLLVSHRSLLTYITLKVAFSSFLLPQHHFALNNFQLDWYPFFNSFSLYIVSSFLNIIVYNSILSLF